MIFEAYISFALVVLANIILIAGLTRLGIFIYEGGTSSTESLGGDDKVSALERKHAQESKQQDKAREQKEKERTKHKVEKIKKKEEEIQKEILKKQEDARQAQTLKKEWAAPEVEEVAPEPQNFLERLKQGVSKTRNQLWGGLGNAVLGKKEIDEDVLDDLEEVLIGADLGPETTQRILDSLTERMERKELSNADVLKKAVQEEITRIMSKSYDVPGVEDKKPLVLLFVGVNGVGKTTTIGKIAAQYREQGKRVLLGAGDTFRAAAIEQLAEWSKRADCEIIAKSSGSDPSSVMYETVKKAVDENYDVVICDTAGRLHTKKNLMEELRKMLRVIKKIIPDAPHEVLLVLDATTGQNAIFQTREFLQAAQLTGLVVTKLDGTAKGGVIIGIVNEFDIPVRYIGIGEGIEDLRPFDPQQFTESLFA